MQPNPLRTRARRKSVALYSLSGLLAATVAFRLAHSSTDAPQVEIEAAAPRTIFSSVTGSGRVQARVKADVSSDLAGRVVELRVQEGDKVRVGDTLAVLDSNDADVSVDRARAELAGAQSQQAEAHVRRVQAAADSARIVRLAKLDPADVSAEDLEKVRTAAQVAASQVESASHGVDRASAQLKEALNTRNKTKILAPLTGIVTRLSIGVGETAVTGGLNKYSARLLTIADMNSLEIRVKLDETDVVATAVGDSAVVVLDALPSTSIAGRVTRISRSAVELPNANSGSQSAEYEVAVDLLNPPREIRSDFSGSAQILTGQVRAPVTVPLSALRGTDEGPSSPGRKPHKGTDGETVVVVLPDLQHVELRRVKVGLSDDQYVEVSRGLRQGELVVTAPFEILQGVSDAAMVRVSRHRR